MGAKIREYLLLGLISVAPLAITVWVLWSAIRFLDGFMPLSLQPFPGLGIVLCFLILLFTGVLAKTFTGKLLNAISENLFNRLPVVRGLYSVSKQISQALFSKDSNKSFKRVVYIPFMSAKSKTIGFVTGEIPDEKKLLVFVPTAPNPTGGYVLLFDEKDVEDCPFSVDEAFKIIVSCGATVHE
jgi:uncharacterized membrane protein